jgi:hypothetical protein
VTHVDGGTTLRGMGAAVPGFLVAIAIAGCARESATAAESPAFATPDVDVVVERSIDGGDVLGFRWGDPMATVLATEETRGHRIPGTSRFETTLAGVPVQLAFSASDGQLAGASALVVWPDEAAACAATTPAAFTGSACSLQSAAYVVDAYGRLEAMLVAQFGERFMVTPTEAEMWAVLPFARSATSLDQSLVGPDASLERGVRLFGNERVQVFTYYLAPRAAGTGWQLRLDYTRNRTSMTPVPPMEGIEKSGLQEEH